MAEVVEADGERQVRGVGGWGPDVVAEPAARDMPVTVDGCVRVGGAGVVFAVGSSVYAGSDGQPRFVRDFVAVWDKVMMADRYDVADRRADRG